MRKMMVTSAAFVGVAIASLAGAAPAAAYDYPWCVQGRSVGYPGECSYQSFRQCQVSASGRNASCGINPMVAFGPPRGEAIYVDPRPVPRRLRHRLPYSY